MISPPRPRALITGGNGFIGRVLRVELVRRGYRVEWMDLPTNDMLYRQYWPNRHPGHYDLFVHAAWLEPHRVAIDTKPNLLAHNMMLDLAAFEWADQCKPKRMVYISSSAVYPVDLQRSGRWTPLMEGLTSWRPAAPDADYGWAKLTGERLAANARKMGQAVTVVRPFSGYGTQQSENHPFKAILKRVLERQQFVEIWGDMNQIRDFIHVDDIVGGIIAAAERGIDGPVNLCSGIAVSLEHLARSMVMQLNRLSLPATPEYDPEIIDNSRMPMGVHSRVGDPTSMIDFYTRKVSLAEGIERAILGKL